MKNGQTKKMMGQKFLRDKSLYIALCLVIFSACSAQPQTPKSLAEKAEFFYQKAIAAYKDELSKNGGGENLRSELARLYYGHGEFENAISELRRLKSKDTQKLLAYCYYKTGRYTQALEIFDKLGRLPDEEYLFFYGLTCKEHNLFEQAINIFNQLKSVPYAQQAKAQVMAIQGRTSGFLKSIEGLPKDMQENFKQIIDEANEDKFPLAGAVVILADEKIELTPQNKLVQSLHFLVKILNERGKKDFSEIEVSYDSTYEQLDIEYARTISPSGGVIEAGQKDIRDVSRYLNFPLYSNARVKIISMPDVVDGSLVEYKVRLTSSQLINNKDFHFAYNIYENEPIIFAGLKIIIPRERDLKVKAINENFNKQGIILEPNISQTAQAKSYSWEFRDIPQIEMEANMPPIAEISPVILVSTFESWQDIYQWWRLLYKDRIQPDDEITNKAKELIAAETTDEEKIRRIYNYCAQEIRYVAVEYGQAGYQPHAAAEIFKNKYGDCKDKAILFISMLKSAGLNGYPVLIGTRGMPALEKDFPAALFNHAIAAVELSGNVHFLDITAEVCSFGDLPEDDQQRKVLVFKEDKYEIMETPLFDWEHNRIEYNIQIELTPEEKIKAGRQIATAGLFDQAQRYWLRYTPENLIEASLSERIQDFAVSGKLLNYSYENRDDPNKPISLIYEFEGDNFLNATQSLRIFPLFADLDTQTVAKETRIWPLDLGLPHTKEAYYNIKMPAPLLKIKLLPQNVDFKCPWFDYFISYNLTQEGSLEIKQRQVIKIREVSIKEYPRYKKSLEGLSLKLKQHVIAERKQ